MARDLGETLALDSDPADRLGLEFRVRLASLLGQLQVSSWCADTLIGALTIHGKIQVCWSFAKDAGAHRNGLVDVPRLKPLPLNDLITRDPSGTHRDAADFCPDGKMPSAELLALEARRWSSEVTFTELRAHLGMETQRQSSDLAMTRMTPVLMGLFSGVNVLAVQWHERGEPTACGLTANAKREPTFSVCLA